jgi:uncharacterized membrane protein
MNDITTASILFAGVGLLYIALGIPLLRGRVKPNSWYGCRTQKTLSDETIWYAVNRVTGRYMIVSGVLLIVSSLVVFAVRSQINSTQAALILLVVLISSVGMMVIKSVQAQKQF